ncbi:MAG: hypothetical protein ACKOWG_11270, partial [Planctomycetia bacterium]
IRHMIWSHVYDPLGWPLLSTLVALLPLAALLGLLAGAGWSAHAAAKSPRSAASGSRATSVESGGQPSGS